MIKSMTGYGRAEGTCEGVLLAVELKSLNHRFRNLALKLPDAFQFLDPSFRKVLSDRFARGSIDLSIRFPQGQKKQAKLVLDTALARQYFQLLNRLRKELKLKEPVSISHLSQFGGWIRIADSEGNLQRQVRLLKQLFPKAMNALEESRRSEGKTIQEDLQSRLRGVERAMTRVRKRVPQAIRAQKQRFRSRLREIAGDVSLDARRLSQEAAILIERSDISEEVSRMSSHIKRFKQILRVREPVGRTLDFLLQEMLREVNTLGSKGNDLSISHEVVLIKGELEKLKEQVQNVE